MHAKYYEHICKHTAGDGSHLLDGPWESLLSPWCCVHIQLKNEEQQTKKSRPGRSKRIKAAAGKKKDNENSVSS